MEIYNEKVDFGPEVLLPSCTALRVGFIFFGICTLHIILLAMTGLIQLWLLYI